MAELPLDRGDVTAIIEALFDLRVDTRRILAILEDENGEEEEDPEADS